MRIDITIQVKSNLPTLRLALWEENSRRYQSFIPPITVAIKHCTIEKTCYGLQIKNVQNILFNDQVPLNAIPELDALRSKIKRK